MPQKVLSFLLLVGLKNNNEEYEFKLSFLYADLEDRNTSVF